MSNKERLFCSKPFSWFEVQGREEQGDTYMCCPSWLDKPIGNLLRSSVEEVWNGPTAADIRRSILDGSFDYCSRIRCPFLQTASGPVRPVADVVDPLMRRAIDEHLTVLPWGPLEINASYDRSCNLSCPSCRTNVIMEHNRRDQILTIQGKLQRDALKQAKLLYITGSGDPFGSPYFRNWLQTMQRSDMPVLEKIHLHTNALLFTKRVWDTISEEVRKLVHTVEISIDAASSSTYSINRRGGDFERLLNNLEFIGQLRCQGPLEWLGISMVVQENNFHEMDEFVRLGKRFNVDTVYFSQLVNWGTFDDQEYRRRAVHLPAHPKHSMFLQKLQDSIFDDKVVYLGNLTSLRSPVSETTQALTGSGKQRADLLFTETTVTG